jgi:hypothetical protein
MNPITNPGFAARITEPGHAVPMGDPDMVITFDDPGFPQLRQKGFDEIAQGTFAVNGIKYYRASVGGGKCVLEGWGG